MNSCECLRARTICARFIESEKKRLKGRRRRSPIVCKFLLIFPGLMCVCVNPRTIIWVAIHILIKNSSTMLVKVRWIWEGGDFAEVQAVPSNIKCHWVGWVNWLAIFHSQTLTFHRFPFQLRLSFITLPFPLLAAATTIPRHCLTCLLMCACLLARSLSLWEYNIFWMMRIFSNLFSLPSFFSLYIEKAFIKQNTSDVWWVLISLLPVVLLARLYGNKALSCAS